MNFENFEHRVAIKFLTRGGIAPKNMHQSLVSVYGDRVPLKTTVKKLAAKFKRGRVSIEDDPHIDQLVEVMTVKVALQWNDW